LEEREVGGVSEAGAENAVVDHGEVERRNIKVLSVSSVAIIVVVDDHRLVAVIGFDRPAHLVLVIDRPRSRRWGFKGIKALIARHIWSL
jgi:hypothetical protein